MEKWGINPGLGIEEIKIKLQGKMDQIPGRTGLFYKNLITGETVCIDADEEYLAASVIKLPLFCCYEMLDAQGKISLEEKIIVTEEDKVPVCGALTLFTGEVEADIRTLCKLMISISDNTATNVLINRLGIDKCWVYFQELLGFKGTRIYRLLFDDSEEARGLENKIVLTELADLLEKIYRNEFVNEAVSQEIIDILLLQQINHKMYGRITDDVDMAHKTGEAEGITNDVGIVYAEQPFVLCFAGNDTDVPEFEDFIRWTSAMFYERCNKDVKKVK